MDVKLALKAPDAFIASLNTPMSAEIQAQLHEFHAQHLSITKAIKAIQQRKGAVASQFKRAKDKPETLATLKAEMQSVSKELGDMQTQLKLITHSATELLTPLANSQSPEMPGQFQQLKTNIELAVTTSICSDEEQAEYNAFISSLDHRNAYQNIEIAQIIEKTFGHSTILVLARVKNELVGALPLTIIKSRLFGHTATSMPFFNYGGPITQYKDVAERLISDASSLLKDSGVENIEVRTTLEDLPFPSSSKKVSMVRAVPSTDTILDAELGSKLRAQVKRAEEHTPIAKFGSEELLDDFYQVFATNMRDLGTPVYSKNWFRNLLRSKSLRTTLVVCYQNSKPVSVGFLLGHNGMLEIPWASTLRSANHMNMNMWMYRQILSYAISEGYTHFDFGRSTKDASTYKFKKQWGAKPIKHYWYYLNETGQTEGANPDSPKYKLLIATWKLLPVWLTKLIGPPIVKSIP